jgi:hypothetical protein
MDMAWEKSASHPPIGGWPAISPRHVHGKIPVSASFSLLVSLVVVELPFSKAYSI